MLNNEPFAVLIWDTSVLDEESHDKNDRLSLMVNMNKVLSVIGCSLPLFSDIETCEDY